MRRMSFALTTDQILDRTKTVTRRLGWRTLKVGERLLAVDKLRVKNWRPLGVIEVVSVRREPLNRITDADVTREGFSADDMPVPCGTFGLRAPTPAEWFVQMFCRSMKCQPDIEVNRIEFRYVEESER